MQFHRLPAPRIDQQQAPELEKIQGGLSWKAMKCKGCAFFFEFWIRPSQCLLGDIFQRDHNWQIFLKVILQPDKSFFNQMNINCFILYHIICFVVFISLVYIILSAFVLEGNQRWCRGECPHLSMVSPSTTQIFMAGIGCEIFNQATFDYRHLPVSLKIMYPNSMGLSCSYWTCYWGLFLTLRQTNSHNLISLCVLLTQPFLMLKSQSFMVMFSMPKHPFITLKPPFFLVTPLVIIHSKPWFFMVKPPCFITFHDKAKKPPYFS